MTAEDEPLRRRVGRPKGKRNGIFSYSSTSSLWTNSGEVEDTTNTHVDFRHLSKEDLLKKSASLPQNLELFDVCRRPRTLPQENVEKLLERTVRLSDTGLTEDLSCPICMGTYQNVAVVKDCLHRFCEECIERWLRTGHQDCPKCRKRIPSRRSLRADPIFQRIVKRLFPDVEVRERCCRTLFLQSFERQNDNAVALVNRRRSGLAVGATTRPRRGKQSALREYEAATTTELPQPPVNVIDLQLIPENDELSALRKANLKPLKQLSVDHLIRMLRSNYCVDDLELATSLHGSALEKNIKLQSLLDADEKLLLHVRKAEKKAVIEGSMTGIRKRDSNDDEEMVKKLCTQSEAMRTV